MTDPAAVARTRGYALLADLFTRGLTPHSLAAWRTVPDVYLPDDDAAALEQDAEARAQVMLQVPERGSAFLSEEGLVGGSLADEAAELHAESGDPDHVGTLLRAVGRADDPRPVLDWLLRWLPAFVAAIGDVPEVGLYGYAARTALDLAASHRASLGGAPASWSFPALRPVLDDPRAGLRDVAEHLCVTTQAGGWIPRARIEAIARALDLPTTFGSRADRLEGLLRSAAHYGRVPEVCVALERVLDDWDGAWQAVEAAGLGVTARPWRERIADTRRMVRRIEEGAGTGG